MTTRESRHLPAPAPQVCATDSIVPQSDTLSLDERAFAVIRGFDLGWHARGEANAQERVAEILHEHACKWAGIARQQATERHGPAWAALVCGEGE